jgi:23S rRNA (adenine2503-C2)-methyltransferase
VETAIVELHNLYGNADLLISTVGIDNTGVMYRLGQISEVINKVGLQFSIHEALDDNRNGLIPYKNKLSLRQIRDYGVWWNGITGRKVYLNYCLNGTNMSEIEKNRLMDLFPTGVFNFTFSVVCNPNETMKQVGDKNLVYINSVSNEFQQHGYDVRVFDPAGQDDIGGGCGQLWYVQKWMKEKGLKN